MQQNNKAGPGCTRQLYFWLFQQTEFRGSARLSKHHLLPTLHVPEGTFQKVPSGNIKRGEGGEGKAGVQRVSRETERRGAKENDGTSSRRRDGEVIKAEEEKRETGK